MKPKTNTDPIFSDPRLASIYDAFDPDRDDLLPYVKMIKDIDAKQVIDLGCGTGVLSLLLEKEGVHVIAIDPAEASLNIARSKPNADKVEWIVGDASVLPVNAADIVVMTGNVAQAIIEPEQWELTLNHIRAALRSGGQLVFETRNPDFEAWTEWNKESSFQSISIPGIGLVDGWVELTKVNFPLVSFKWTYFFHEDSTTLVSDSTIRFRTLSEVKHDLTSNGFKVKDVREAPDRHGKEYLVTAQVL